MTPNKAHATLVPDTVKTNNQVIFFTYLFLIQFPFHLTAKRFLVSSLTFRYFISGSFAFVFFILTWQDTCLAFFPLSFTTTDFRLSQHKAVCRLCLHIVCGSSTLWLKRMKSANTVRSCATPHLLPSLFQSLPCHNLALPIIRSLSVFKAHAKLSNRSNPWGSAPKSHLA